MFFTRHPRRPELRDARRFWPATHRSHSVGFPPSDFRLARTCASSSWVIDRAPRDRHRHHLAATPASLLETSPRGTRDHVPPALGLSCENCWLDRHVARAPRVSRRGSCLLWLTSANVHKSIRARGPCSNLRPHWPVLVTRSGTAVRRCAFRESSVSRDGWWRGSCRIAPGRQGQLSWRRRDPRWR